MSDEPLTGDDEQFIDGEWYERTTELRLARLLHPGLADGVGTKTLWSGDTLQQKWVAPSGKKRWERVPVVAVNSWEELNV